MEESDAQLVTRAQDGEGDAFAALVARHREPLLRLLRRFAPCRDDAQDLTQETFVAAFLHLDRLREPERFGAWLRQIAVNTARQWWRRETQISFEPLWDDPEPECRPAAPPEDRSARLLAEIVHDALGALPPEPRSVVLLHYFDGYDYSETAALLDVPVSTVRGRLYVARRRLRKEMAELAPQKAKTEPSPAVTETFDLTAEDLAALRGAYLLAGRDPERPVLQSICIEPDGTLVATDTHRMYVQRGSSIRPGSRLLVSRSLVGQLAAELRIESARLSVAGTQAELRLTTPTTMTGEHSYQGPLVTEGRYPAYDRIIPGEAKLTAFIGVRDLLLALEEIARFEQYLAHSAMPDTGRQGQRLTLTFSAAASALTLRAGALKVYPAPTHWSLQVEVPAELSGLAAGEEFRIAVNRSYLRECPLALNVLPSERIELRFTEPLRPVRIQPESNSDRFTLVMPMNLQ